MYIPLWLLVILLAAVVYFIFRIDEIESQGGHVDTPTDHEFKSTWERDLMLEMDREAETRRYQEETRRWREGENGEGAIEKEG